MSRWNGVVRAATVGATASTSSPASSRPTDSCARTELIGQRYDDFASDGCLDVPQPPPGWEPAAPPRAYSRGRDLDPGTRRTRPRDHARGTGRGTLRPHRDPARARARRLDPRPRRLARHAP